MGFGSSALKPACCACTITFSEEYAVIAKTGKVALSGLERMWCRTSQPSGFGIDKSTITSVGV